MEGWGGGRPSQVPGLHEQVSLLPPPASGLPSSWPWGQAVLGGDYSFFRWRWLSLAWFHYISEPPFSPL